MAEQRIHFIGGGQMAEAILRALIERDQFSPATFSVTDIDPVRLQTLQQRYRIRAGTHESLLPQTDIVVLAVRPQDDLPAVGAEIQRWVRPGAILVSLIAGVTITHLEQLTGQKYPVVRIIPNTLTPTGYGYSGVTYSPKALASGLAEDAVLERFFSGFGKVEHLPETWIDIFTGYGVAGPNYVYYFIESLADAGVLSGLPRPLAWKIALENLKGAVAMLEQTQLHPRQLLDINNSAGGVGIHGLYELNNSDFAAGLQRSVKAAVQRTRELGGVSAK